MIIATGAGFSCRSLCYTIVYKKFTENLADENGSVVQEVTLWYDKYINITYNKEEFSS